MLKRPHVEDFKRKIKVVFFDRTDHDLETYRPFFSSEYFELKGERNFNHILSNMDNEIPDIIVCTDNFTICSKSVQKVIHYIKYNDFYRNPKEVSMEVKKIAYQNYIDKIKYQIYLVIGKKENPNKSEVIKKIVNLLELKDRYLRDHSIRVATYSISIGKKLKLSEEKLEQLKNIALLHDIGKLGIPFNIINKPKELTKEEERIYEYHTLIGRYILDFPLFDGMKKSILYHHERVDGQGYFKKKKEEIPLYARIIAIANTFDILTTTNLYGKRLTYKEAVKKLSNYTKETKKMPFDFRLVKVFLKCLEEEMIFPDMNLLMDNMLINIEMQGKNC